MEGLLKQTSKPAPESENVLVSIASIALKPLI